MRTVFKPALLIAILATVMLVALLSFSFRSPVSPANAVSMTFLGYTNLPGNPLQFALFSVSNHAHYAVRWRGSWIEVEGNPERKAEVLNPNLPGFVRDPALKARDSLLLAIGDPLYDSAHGRWRFVMSCAPYTWRDRWLDFSLQHSLVQRLGSMLLLDPQHRANPGTNTTITTAWLTK